MPQESRILPWQVMTVDQTRLQGRVGVLPPSIMAVVDARLRLVWEL